MAAGLAQFSRGGYAETTVEQLVTAAGVSPPVLYHHFGTKAGLFISVAREVYARVIDRFRHVFDGDASFPEALRRMIEIAAYSHPDDPYARPMVLTVVIEMRRQPSLETELRETARELRVLFDRLAGLAPVELVERAGGRRELSAALVSISHGINVSSLGARHPADPTTGANALMALMGLSAPA